jgi:transcriptional regulator with XRE-family HTH domain
MHDKIGPALRRARLDRGVSLRSLAATAGVSPSQLSQIETGKSQPSVATLYTLVNSLEASLDELLGIANGRAGGDSSAADLPRSARTPDPSNGVIQRGADNPVLDMANGVRWEKLAVDSRTDVDALLVTYGPGAASSLDRLQMRHQGTEHAYLLTGELTLLLDFDRHTVRAGDSLCFDSTRPHLYLNESDVDARGIWFVSGRGPSAAAAAAQTTPPRESSPFSPPAQISSAVDALHVLGAIAPTSARSRRK